MTISSRGIIISRRSASTVSIVYCSSSGHFILAPILPVTVLSMIGTTTTTTTITTAATTTTATPAAAATTTTSSTYTYTYGDEYFWYYCY